MPDLVSSLNSSQMSMVTTVSGSTSLGIIFLLIVVIAGIIGLLVLLTSLERYTKFLDTCKNLVYTIKYTLFGAGATAIGYSLYILGNYLQVVGKGIDPLWVIEAIGVYVGLTILGYILSRIYRKAKSMHKLYKEKKEVPDVPAL